MVSLFLLLAGLRGAAQTGGTTPSPGTGDRPVVVREADGRVTARASRITEPLRVDGRLDEAVYDKVPPITDFIQQEPVWGAADFRKDRGLAAVRRHERLCDLPLLGRASRPHRGQRHAAGQQQHPAARPLRRAVRHVPRSAKRLHVLLVTPAGGHPGCGEHGRSGSTGTGTLCGTARRHGSKEAGSLKSPFPSSHCGTAGQANVGDSGSPVHAGEERTRPSHAGLAGARRQCHQSSRRGRDARRSRGTLDVETLTSRSSPTRIRASRHRPGEPSTCGKRLRPRRRRRREIFS